MFGAFDPSRCGHWDCLVFSGVLPYTHIYITIVRIMLYSHMQKPNRT